MITRLRSTLCLRRSPWTVVPLFVLAVTSVAVGGWAQFAPGSFFEGFPLGEGWVSSDGPYNEHLVRDVGGLNLALGAVTIAVVLVGDASSRRFAAFGWFVYGLAHVVYHLHHLEPFDTVDALLVGAATASTPVLALVALVSSASSARTHDSCRAAPGSGRRVHVALGVLDVERSIEDYTDLVGRAPAVVVAGEYALWVDDHLNLSIRAGDHVGLRHLGWEDAGAASFTCRVDTNGLTWERFTLEQQLEEIRSTWPSAVPPRSARRDGEG